MTRTRTSIPWIFPNSGRYVFLLVGDRDNTGTTFVSDVKFVLDSNLVALSRGATWLNVSFGLITEHPVDVYKILVEPVDAADRVAEEFCRELGKIEKQ